MLLLWRVGAQHCRHQQLMLMFLGFFFWGILILQIKFKLQLTPTRIVIFLLLLLFCWWWWQWLLSSFDACWSKAIKPHYYCCKAADWVGGHWDCLSACLSDNHLAPLGRSLSGPMFCQQQQQQLISVRRWLSTIDYHCQRAHSTSSLLFQLSVPSFNGAALPLQWAAANLWKLVAADDCNYAANANAVQKLLMKATEMIDTCHLHAGLAAQTANSIGPIRVSRLALPRLIIKSPLSAN